MPIQRTPFMTTKMKVNVDSVTNARMPADNAPPAAIARKNNRDVVTSLLACGLSLLGVNCPAPVSWVLILSSIAIGILTLYRVLRPNAAGERRRADDANLT